MQRTLSNPHQYAFLAAYSECCNISEAARIAEISRQQHYEWLKDPEYKRVFEDAHNAAVEALELECRRRAYEGVAEPVIYQGQRCFEAVRDANGQPKLGEDGEPIVRPLVVHRKSDILLMFLLKSHKPDTYRENSKVELTGSIDIAGRLRAARERLKQEREPQS